MRIENGILQNAEFHNERLARTVKDYFRKPLPPEASDLESLLKTRGIPEEFQSGCVKCRFLYDFIEDDFSYRIEYAHYIRREINTLMLVEGSPDYRFKYTDRSALDLLMAEKGSCDDVIIVKNGLLTDAWSSNIVLLKSGQWYTPAHPLLLGTARAKLLSEGRITERDIEAAEIKTYEALKLINAMLPFGQQPLIPVSAVESL